MFCKKCGKQIDDNAAFCPNCGEKTTAKPSFCRNCGVELPVGAFSCPNCGASVACGAAATQGDASNQANGERKSKMAAGLLGIFLGALGIHNFYLGYTGKAVTQLLLSVLSCGLFTPITSIWGLIEGILILTGNIKIDGKGNPLSE